MDKPLFPRIKPELQKFLLEEEGNIPRSKMLTLGTMVLVLGILYGSEAFAKHGSHTSHGSHVSHSSHSSHTSGSHSSHASHSSSISPSPSTAPDVNEMTYQELRYPPKVQPNSKS